MLFHQSCEFQKNWKTIGFKLTTICSNTLEADGQFPINFQLQEADFLADFFGRLFQVSFQVVQFWKNNLKRIFYATIIHYLKIIN
jgi:hypothetical protein